MKKLKVSAACAAVLSLLSVAVSSCSSDPNPVGYVTLKGEKAYLSLDLSVADTRAAGDATDEESKLTKVSVYIFDDTDHLESINPDLDVKADKINKVETTAGFKTIYAIAATSVADASANTDTQVSITLADFEQLTLPSKLAELKNGNGFVMVGKSERKRVIATAEENVPVANSFDVTLQRIAAKAQVKLGESFISSAEEFGFTASDASFSVRQTADAMFVAPGNYAPEDDPVGGTYAGYTFDSESSYENCVATFTADNCKYMSENIVETPVSGNTTFASVKIKLVPKKRYSYDATSKELSSSESSSENTYYVVGAIDEVSGIADYVVGDDKKVICFDRQDDADKYCAALNGGEASGITVSESGVDMKAPALTRADEPTYEVVAFTDSYAYYRVNIRRKSDDGSSKKYGVDRNTFYKITLNSLKTLGFNEESKLRPTNPKAKPDITPSTWVDATFTIADWDDVDQGVDL